MRREECPEKGIAKIFFSSFTSVVVFMSIAFFLYEHKSLLVPVSIIPILFVLIFYRYKEAAFESMDNWIEIEAEVNKAEVIQCDCRFSPYRGIQKQEDMYKPHITLL